MPFSQRSNGWDEPSDIALDTLTLAATAAARAYLQGNPANYDAMQHTTRDTYPDVGRSAVAIRAALRHLLATHMITANPPAEWTIRAPALTDDPPPIKRAAG